MHALEINNLNYSYQSNWSVKRTQALFDINVSVEPGEVFGFLGKSGSGKTTTIKCILNLVQPLSGKVLLFGKVNSDPDARKEVGYVPEQPYFYDHLSVNELLEMYANLIGVEKGKCKATIEVALERVHLSEKLKAPLRSLSKGQTQRVAMAQAILGTPKLLVLDEPFSGLDPLGRKQFKDLLFELKQDGTAIFVSSHILEDIQNLCDRVSIMDEGRIKTVLSLKELSDYTKDTFEIILTSEHETELSSQKEILPGGRTRYSFPDKQSSLDALKKVMQSNIEIESYQHHKGTLEELFVEVVGS